MAGYVRACDGGGPCRCRKLAAIEAEAKAESADPSPTIPSVGSVEPSMAYYTTLKNPAAELLRVAHHEAGHAVVAAGLGLRLLDVRIAMPAVTRVEYVLSGEDRRPELLRVAVQLAAGRKVDESRGVRDWARSRHDVAVADALVSGMVPRCVHDSVLRAVDAIAREAVRDARGAIERVAVALCSEPYSMTGQQVSKLLGSDLAMLRFHAAEVDALAATLPTMPTTEAA